MLYSKVIQLLIHIYVYIFIFVFSIMAHHILLNIGSFGYGHFKNIK